MIGLALIAGGVYLIGWRSSSDIAGSVCLDTQARGGDDVPDGLKEHCGNCGLLEMFRQDYTPPTGYCGHPLRNRDKTMTDFENLECLFWKHP